MPRVRPQSTPDFDEDGWTPLAPPPDLIPGWITDYPSDEDEPLGVLWTPDGDVEVWPEDDEPEFPFGFCGKGE